MLFENERISAIPAISHATNEIEPLKDNDKRDTNVYNHTLKERKNLIEILNTRDFRDTKNTMI